ncbi:MAG: hypothetical protein IJ289_07850 [Clostridia bacterium]|nr:hypothetical protein [Clostridia bacterium]
MKLAKKTLSIFLSLLMIFSVCSVGLTGITASAAAEDSAYTAAEVAALINAATAGGFTLSSKDNAWNYNADDGKVIAAAEAIFDYAVNAYREGKEATSKGNSSAALYEYFTAEFKSKYTNSAAADKLVKNVLYPDGTTIFSYEVPGTKTTKLGETTTEHTKNQDVTANYPAASNAGMYAAGFSSDIVTKNVNISLDLNKYLMTFATIDDIPSSFLTSVSYIYAHAGVSSATVSDVTTRNQTSGSGCSQTTTTYYTPTITTSAHNYMSGKPVRQVVKNTTARKQLLSYEKYFIDERVGMPVEEMLAMPLADIEALYRTTETFYNQMVSTYTADILAHFGLNPTAMAQFMDNVYFAYRVVAGKYNIDNLNSLIGTTYNEESYAEMSALYAKTSTAYNVVFSLDQEIIDYICSDEGGYAGQYASAVALKTQAESYNAVLFDVMTEQKLEETVASMVDTYTDYYSLLNKEDIETPTDAEVIGLVQKVDAFDSIIASYTGKSYFRNYWTNDYQTAWADFSAKLDEVYEVRGLKIEFETYYDYFMPLIFSTEIDTLDNAGAISLHADLDTKLGELRTSYNNVASKWGYTIADKIFTVNYEGSDYLLQTLIENVKSAGKEAVKTVLVARTEAQLDAVYAYKDTTVVNFDNFASIKSTLTYFDYDLYNYVNGGGEGQNAWLSTDYTNKYAMVQTLLDRYHAFSTTDGHAFFDEDFTFADANGYYAIRYAGNQVDAEGNQIGYPTDIARDGAEDNYYVTEDKMLDTVVRIDNFITSRDFGALIELVDKETEEYTDLATYIQQMLAEMLYTDDLINTLVGAIYPMVVDLLNTELIGMLADMGVNDNPAASACIDLEAMGVDNAKGHLYVYMDDDIFDGKMKQRYLADVLADAGLYVYPRTLADSLMMSNPAMYGVGTPIYTALKAADRDWTKLICEDDPETTTVDETKVLDFEWGVYDSETLVDTLGCIFDSLLPLLNAVLTGKAFNETLNNAAYAYSSDVKYSFISAGKLAAYGHLNLSIPGLTVYNDVLVPLFEILGVDTIPTLKQNASGDDIAKAIINPLLGVIDEVLANPLSTILEILPNLVYFISMDSVQEILNSLNISLNLKIEAEIDKDYSGTLVDLLGGLIVDLLGDNLAFDVNLAIADLIDLYDLLGFEISDFNEILKFALSALSAPPEEGAEEGGLNIDLSGLKLPPIRQQDIIFCSDWTTNAAGRVYLESNKGDLMYWFLDYVVKALIPDENGNSLLTSLLGNTEMDPAIKGLLDRVVSQLTGNPKGALAAIVELLNPTTYDMAEMEWLEGTYNYDGIEGADQMSIVYLNYGNDWTKEKSEYILDNADSLVKSILEMTGSDMTDIGAFLADTVNGLFTNANITALVKMLGGLGDSPSAVINDVVKNQVGINIGSWFTAFGYLFPAETWAEDAEIILPGTRQYVNNFGVEGVANEDGTISWFFNRMPLNDGDGYTFINILSRLLGEASLVIEFLFAGEDISAFEDLLIVKGYETYDTSIGLLLEMLGVENIPTQADFNNDAMGSFTNMLMALLDWFYALTSSDDMVAQLVELLPDLFYYIESNGLSTLLHNLLMPVLVLVDTVRPLIDVDINGLLSIIVSDFINNGAINMDALLEYLVHGIYMNDDPNYKWFNIDVNNLTVSEILKLVDGYLGTDLYNSGLYNVGIKGYCSGLEKIENTAVGTVYKPSIDAADTMTILVTALLDCLDAPAADPSKTNGDAIFALIAELTENEAIASYYPVIKDVIAGVDITYADPDWGYMFASADDFSLTLPQQSIVYLGYSTDWTPEAAESVYGILDEVLDLVLPEVLEEGETLDTLINGLLEDNVYSDAVLNKLVELIVNAIGTLDSSLRDLIDVAIDTDIAAWFAMCEETVGEDGKTKFVCTKNWGIDAAAEADKKALFIAALKEVLTPAERLLSWLFFGNDIALFTGSETDDNGEYVYNDIITVNGGEGYAYGLVPIFEALGCEMQPATAYTTTADAVESLLNALFARVDEITADPVAEVFDLLPNLIYFINADGLVACVNNLLAPVDGLIAKLSPIISEDGSAVSIGGLLEPTIGLNISNLTTEALLQFAADKDVKLSPEMVDIICNLYVGKLAEFESANGRKAYRLDVTGAEGDVLTIVLSIALDLFKLNKELFAPLMGEDIYDTVVTLIAGAVSEFTYKNPDWAYMYDGEDALAQLIANGLPARTEENSYVYLQYTNNWNRETALYLDDVLFDLIKGITEDARDDGKDVGILLDDAITNGLYQDDILNSLIEAVVGLMIDYEEIIKGAGALLGAESISEWFDYCEVTTDANGETVVTCTHNWGVDAATTNDAKREAFVEGFVTALKPAYRLLAWLLFGEDYTFLNGTTSEVLITIKGGKGYAEGLVPLLEALGCTMGADTASGIKAPADFYVNGELDMEQAVRDVFGALAGWLDAICGDMSNGAIDVMLDKLPNFVYFINAGGLKAVVNNLLQPVNFILEAIEPMGVSVDFSTLIEQIDITNIDFYAIFALVEDLVPLYFPDEIQTFVAEFWMGEAVEYTSANGKQAFRMQYTDAECRADMITVLVSLVLEAAQDPRNEAKLSDWLGEDIYWAILNVLRLEKCKDMEEFAWILTEYANTGEQFSAIETSTRYAAYNDIWTKDKAQDMVDNLGYMSGNLLHLLGVQINGEKTYDLESVLNALISTNLYTQEMADTILNAVKDLLSNLTELEPYGEYIIDILNTAFDVDLTAYDTMTVTVEDGSREDFEAALGQIIAPIVPLLEVILCGENISLFYELDGSETIVLYGSEGYAYGIIPVMEALGCTMPTPAEFKEIVKNDPDAAIKCITTPLLDRVDKIVADPVNGLGEILASAMYFINSNGLETAFTNLVAAVDTVLAGLENVVGAASLAELLDIDLSEYNAEYIVNLVADLLSESTGMDFAPVAANLVAELTFGEVVTYDSANGETYYTMKATGNDEADMLTAVLRMVIDFVTTEDNLAKIKTLLADTITNESAYNSICSILDTLAGYVAEDPGMSTALNFIYTVLDAAGTALENTDDVYHDVNNSWQFILKLLSTSEEPLLRDFAEDLKGTLNKYFDGIFTEEGVAPDGALTFFDKLKAFFEKIAEFFRKLFGME